MVIVLMGVCGSGKTTVGRELALQLDCPFYDGDDEHPPKNTAKMKRGVPLNAEDRAPWIRSLAARIKSWLTDNKKAVLACSALTEEIRNKLSGGDQRVRFVHLKGAKALIAGRLSSRSGHYMPASLLDSQLETLEEPPGAVSVNISEEPARLVAQIRRALGA